MHVPAGTCIPALLIVCLLCLAIRMTLYATIEATRSLLAQSNGRADFNTTSHEQAVRMAELCAAEPGLQTSDIVLIATQISGLAWASTADRDLAVEGLTHCSTAAVTCPKWIPQDFSFFFRYLTDEMWASQTVERGDDFNAIVRLFDFLRLLGLGMPSEPTFCAITAFRMICRKQDVSTLGPSDAKHSYDYIKDVWKSRKYGRLEGMTFM